jgi:hypothetical protein
MTTATSHRRRRRRKWRWRVRRGCCLSPLGQQAVDRPLYNTYLPLFSGPSQPMTALRSPPCHPNANGARAPKSRTDSESLSSESGTVLTTCASLLDYGALGSGAYNPVRNRVRDKLLLTDEMGRPVSVPAYYGMRLRRARMPMRIRGHIDLPINSKVVHVKLVHVLQSECTFAVPG